MSLAIGTIVVACPGVVDGTVTGLFAVDPHSGEQRLLAQGGLLVAPSDVVFLADGRLLVADVKAFGFGGLIAVDPASGQQTRVTSSAVFQSPRALARAADGQIIVGYQIGPAGTGAVLRVDPATGDSHDCAPGFDVGVPSGVAVDGAGRIFVTDPFDFTGNQNRLIRIDGNVASVRSDFPGFHFSAVAIDRTGHVVIPSDDPGAVHGHLFRFDPDSGPPAIVAQGILGVPGGIAVEASGAIVLNDGRGVIRIDPGTGSQSRITSIHEATGLTISV